MSQFPQAPPPGAYVPPSESTPQLQGQGHNQQQPQYYQQPQAPSPYQSSGNYGAPQHPQKGGAPAAISQMFNQAVTTGKPLLNKLGKTISSKVGGKHSSQATPSHLQSYQNYQQHSQQQNPSEPQQSTAQQFHSQPQQPQWQQQQQQQQQQQPPQNAYPSPQSSQYSQLNYATPPSGHASQNNYFPQQSPQGTDPPQSQQQTNAPNYNAGPPAQGQNVGSSQDQSPQGYFQTYSHGNQEQLQGQPQQGQYPGQQAGVIRPSQSPQNTTQQAAATPPNFTSPPNQQQAWAPPTPSPGIVQPSAHDPLSAAQQAHAFSPTPPPQTQGAPTPPAHPKQQQHQQQWQPSPPQPQQQWQAVCPASPPAHAQLPSPVPHSVSPPPPPTPGSQHRISAPVHPQPQQSEPPQQPPTPQHVPPPSGPTSFIAELPAGYGEFKPTENPQAEQPTSSAPQGSQYQAYQPPPTNSSRHGSFTVPRRAVSTSSFPLADPWRIADPSTEQPTREFLILADLLFDGIDRSFEPQNTGLIEASKLLQAWRTQQLAEEAAVLFAYDSYQAFGKLFTLTGVPHVLVPIQPFLSPIWNFQAQSHVQELKIPAGPAPANVAYPTYMAALNRAGWYKYCFLECNSEPEKLGKFLSTFCADTYKPDVLNQPDLQKQDRTEHAALKARAQAVEVEATKRVCEETAAAMQAAQRGSIGVVQQPGMSEQELALKMQSLQMQQQPNNNTYNYTKVSRFGV